jgi:hypothetical protein
MTESLRAVMVRDLDDQDSSEIIKLVVLACEPQPSSAAKQFHIRYLDPPANIRYARRRPREASLAMSYQRRSA